MFDKALSLAYEIEGLLHLLKHRRINDVPDAVKNLLAEKGRQLSAILNEDSNLSVEEAVSDAVAASTDTAISKIDSTSFTDSQRLAETVAYEQEEDSQPEAGAPDAYETKLDVAQAEEDEADTESAEIDAARNDYYAEIAQKRTGGASLAARFTLNDRYRFVKELFGNSNTAFNVILEEISTFGTLKEVKQYLTDRQGINVDSGAGKDFCAILAPAFNN